MKSRSFFLGLGAMVVALLLVAVVGFSWVAAQSPLTLLQGGKLSSPAAAMFVPKQSPGMVSLLVKPDRLEAFRLAVAAPGERRRARAELETIKQTLLAGQGVDYDADIKPWLGDEITVAVTSADIDRDAGNGLQPGYLLAATTEDPQRAREFLQLFWQKRAIAGTNLVFEQYSGVNLIYGGIDPGAKSPDSAKGRAVKPAEAEAPSPTLPAPPSTLTSAVVGDRFVLFANSPKVLRDAINNVQAPDLSLSSSRAYRQALERLPDRQIGVTFVNLPQLGRWLGNPELTGKPTSDGADRQLFDSLVVGLELSRQGVLAETALLAAPGQTLAATQPALTQPVGALQFLPAAAPVAASGQNLRQLWAELTSGLANYGVLSALLNQPIATLERQWGVTFADDLVNWVDREFALGVLPQPNGNPELVFVAEKTATTAPALEHLDAIAQQRGLSVGPVAIGSQNALTWAKLSTTNKRSKNAPTLLQADVEGVRTTINQYEVLTTSVAAMEQVLAVAPQTSKKSAQKSAQKSLLQSPAFRQAIAPIASHNDGYLYIDWQRVKQPLEQRIPALKLAELAGKPFFDHLRSLTISSYGSEANVRRGAVFVQLKDT